METTANLVLTVDDPVGPIGLGGEATYQLRVQNRGTASAQDVEVVAYFANHVEPISADGGRHRLNSGQVVFESLPTLAPGQTASFQVKVKADAAGNHIYRVEVQREVHGRPVGPRRHDPVLCSRRRGRAIEPRPIAQVVRPHGPRAANGRPSRRKPAARRDPQPRADSRGSLTFRRPFAGLESSPAQRQGEAFPRAASRPPRRSLTRRTSAEDRPGRRSAVIVHEIAKYSGDGDGQCQGQHVVGDNQQPEAPPDESDRFLDILIAIGPATIHVILHHSPFPRHRQTKRGQSP